jgi:hypothetical protein
LVAAAICLLLAAGAGTALGLTQRTTVEEASKASKVASQSAFASAEEQAEAEALTRGQEAGRRAGTKTGERSGERNGTADGEADVAAEQAALAEAGAAAEEAAALAERGERFRNCGAPLFVDDYCPTDEEIERENAAESLCGPGTAEGREEAARLGITC